MPLRLVRRPAFTSQSISARIQTKDPDISLRVAFSRSDAVLRFERFATPLFLRSEKTDPRIHMLMYLAVFPSGIGVGSYSLCELDGKVRAW